MKCTLRPSSILLRNLVMQTHVRIQPKHVGLNWFDDHLEQICLAFSCVCRRSKSFKTFLPARRIQSAVLDDVDIAPRIHFLLPKLSFVVCRLQEIGHCCPDFRSQWKLFVLWSRLQTSVEDCIWGGFRPSFLFQLERLIQTSFGSQ